MVMGKMASSLRSKHFSALRVRQGKGDQQPNATKEKQNAGQRRGSIGTSEEPQQTEPLPSLTLPSLSPPRGCGASQLEQVQALGTIVHGDQPGALVECPGGTPRCWQTCAVPEEPPSPTVTRKPGPDIKSQREKLKNLPLSQLLKEQQHLASQQRQAKKADALAHASPAFQHSDLSLLGQADGGLHPAAQPPHGFCPSPVTPLSCCSSVSSDWDPSLCASPRPGTPQYGPLSPLNPASCSPVATAMMPASQLPRSPTGSRANKDPTLRERVLLRSASTVSSGSSNQCGQQEDSCCPLEEDDCGSVDSVCLNFEAIELQCRVLDEHNCVVEAIEIMPCLEAHGSPSDGPEAVLLALFVHGCDVPLVPGAPARAKGHDAISLGYDEPARVTKSGRTDELESYLLG